MTKEKDNSGLGLEINSKVLTRHAESKRFSASSSTKKNEMIWNSCLLEEKMMLKLFFQTYNFKLQGNCISNKYWTVPIILFLNLNNETN